MIIPRPAISRSQKMLALSVAFCVDCIQWLGIPIFMEGAASPLEDGLDLFTAVVLTAICGFRWQLALAFMVELVPFADMFPTWTAMVLTLPVHSDALVIGEKPPVEADAVVGDRK